MRQRKLYIETFYHTSEPSLMHSCIPNKGSFLLCICSKFIWLLFKTSWFNNSQTPISFCRLVYYNSVYHWTEMRVWCHYWSQVCVLSGHRLFFFVKLAVWLWRKILYQRVHYESNRLQRGTKYWESKRREMSARFVDNVYLSIPVRYYCTPQQCWEEQ